MAWSQEARDIASRQKKKYWRDVRAGKITRQRKSANAQISQTKLKNAWRTIIQARKVGMI